MILVLTTYRTGSTSFCNQLAEQHSFENLDECFHESLSKKFVQKNPQYGTGEGMPNIHKETLRYITKNPNCIVKLMPYHNTNSDIGNVVDVLIGMAEKIYVLIRKDFDQQCQSYYICRRLGGGWHDQWQDKVDITLDKDRWLWCVNFLHNEYCDLQTWYEMINKVYLDKFSGLMFTHQLNQKDKYQRPVRWDKAPGFTNIDIEELFI